MAENYQWERHPLAEQLLLGYLDRFCETNSTLSELKDELLHATSTRLFDWIDHLSVEESEAPQLKRVGFERDEFGSFYHPGALFPRVVVGQPRYGVAVGVEKISDFLLARGIHRHIEGSPESGYRSCLVDLQECGFWVVERRGTWTMSPTVEPTEYLARVVECTERWKSRSRSDMEATIQLARELAAEIGADRAAWIVLEVERQYWQTRNRAAQVQKARQDLLGMGWANHDHHTFRSSRRYFRRLVELFEILGFHCRERFYAGEEAGWGAQVMENSRCNAVLFLDVDLDPHELQIDFAHQELPEVEHFGTIGLWCELHGDSILEAGMHHLEAQFMFDELKEDLSDRGVGMMDPFSDFPFLRQAFTQGEQWKVDRARIESLLRRNLIEQEEADQFAHCGAVGSHLENLQRRDGYKGFNQKNVSVIIKKTDPRTLDPRL